MAKVKTINVEASFTKNLGNYQSVRIVAGATVELQEGESVKKIYDDAWDMVGKEMHEQLSLFDEDKKPGVKRG
jgi:hypothetical protein